MTFQYFTDDTKVRVNFVHHICTLKLTLINLNGIRKQIRFIFFILHFLPTITTSSHVSWNQWGSSQIYTYINSCQSLERHSVERAIIFSEERCFCQASRGGKSLLSCLGSDRFWYRRLCFTTISVRIPRLRIASKVLLRLSSVTPHLPVCLMVGETEVAPWPQGETSLEEILLRFLPGNLHLHPNSQPTHLCTRARQNTLRIIIV